MPRNLSDIEHDAMELSLRERAILVERLLATLDPGDDTDAEELWLQEAEKRYAEYRAGKIASKPAEQVMEEAKQRLHDPDCLPSRPPQHVMDSDAAQNVSVTHYHQGHAVTSSNSSLPDVIGASHLLEP